ncbi:protein N-terminal asparagine amidohydrolase isoform X3 [Capsicum annuum]|uniref:protein N-terminal asparagine amidohydrolase isoform X3 n=1 Tax=Capsicum annuum TaxID=4072 RepID=UPI001FB04EDC|nr:protein N-terminal asparagine amidohydrolase isoform X3 [Capsicum annuum]
MIFVGGVSLSTHSSSSSCSQGHDILMDLMRHPVLVSASSAFNDVAERRFSASKDSNSSISRHNRWVYIFQREYATVDPALVDVVGTDEATTCVGLVMRNQKSGMTSVAHLDSPDVVDMGLSQMLAFVINQSSDAMLDVHLIGGFDDASPEHVNGITKSHGKLEGYSFPLCEKIVDSLAKSNMKFQIHTLHVLGHNTRRDSEGNAYPIFTGFLVETATGSILPANFDATTRCPDEVVRRIRVTASFEDCSWNGRLLETYDTQADQFVIAPCTWSMRKMHIALMLQNLSDQEILLMCSTSPSAEAPDFVDNQRSVTI